MTSLFDAPLSPSKTYWGFVGAFLFLVVGLTFLLGASGWQLLVLIGVFAGLVYTSNHRPTPIHLVNLPNLSDWQLLMRTTRGNQLWQGRLISAKMSTFGVLLVFRIDEPLQTELKFWLLFDQLSDDDERKLKMAVRFLGK